MPMSQNVFSVSDLISLIKQTLEFNDGLRAFYVKGEISNFTNHRNGHWYFSIKDDKSKMNCVMFGSYANSVDFKPKEGDQVLLRASISVYALQGSVQCNVFSMQNIGLGNLYIQFEKLKKKLSDQGIFDQSHKKTLPKYPKRIAVVTGVKSAVLQDMFKVAHLRWPMVELVLYETLVQGTNAAAQMIKSLKEADQNHCDIIILARGGGSIEDLWAFNDEALALTIYHLNTAIITGVGHESDTTIVDYVADVRAATPTQAMQTACPDIREILYDLKQKSERLDKSIKVQIKQSSDQKELIKHKLFNKSPELKSNQYRIHLDLLKQKMVNSAQDISSLQKQIEMLKQQMFYHFSQISQKEKTELKNYQSDLYHFIKSILDKKRETFRHQVALVNAYSPLNSLERGYSLTYKEKQLVVSLDQINIGDELKIRLKDGTIQTKVEHKEKNNGK